MLDKDKFHAICPANPDPQGWSDILVTLLPHHEINTPERMSAFIAQCAHESMQFTVLSENLNYGATGLKNIFGKYFKDVDPLQYERKPEKIANRVYANRMGNGDEASGDGWKYRGRGPIQLTGKNNYVSFANDMLPNPEMLINSPELISSNKEICILSAIWFWNKNKLNSYADKQDIKGMTKVINGGYLGLDDRILFYNKAIKVLK